jgi:hypothetical protein
MNKYQVVKAFKDVGDITRSVGDIIALDESRAAKLMQYRLIGLAQAETVAVEEAKEVEEVKEEVKEVVKVEEEEVKEVKEVKKENKKANQKAVN